MISYSQGFCKAYAGQKLISIAKHATVLSLVDGGVDADSIESGDIAQVNFLTLGFTPGDRVYVLGATEALNNIQAVECSAVSATKITLPTGTFTTGQAAGSQLYILASKGGSFVDLMQGGTLYWFKSSKPATADNAASASDVIATFSAVLFGAAQWDAANKQAFVDLLNTITTNGEAAGTAYWYRFVAQGEEAFAASTSAIRADGSIGASGDLVTTNTSVALGAPLAISSFKWIVPQVPA